MKRGNVKVMVGVNGTRIQEEIGDEIKVYALKDWQAELEKRKVSSHPDEKKEVKLPDLDDGDGDFEGVTDAPAPKRGRKKKSA